MAPRPKGTWTPTADAELRRHVDSGLSRVGIAQAMGISRAAVMYRMQTLGLHSGVIRSEAQRANLENAMAERRTLEAQHVAVGRAAQALSYRLASERLADMLANLRAEQERVEDLILHGGSSVKVSSPGKLSNPVSDVREMQITVGIAHDKMAAYRKEDRETSAESVGGDRIVQLVELYQSDAPEYDPDGAV